MGLYDDVLVKCPGCGAETAFQSKGGECLMDTFTLQTVPADVLSDVNRHAPQTCDCGTTFAVDEEARVARRCAPIPEDQQGIDAFYRLDWAARFEAAS